MTFLDCGIGMCDCGVERRLYLPEGQTRSMCQPCALQAFFTAREKRAVNVTTSKKREVMRSRRERLQSKGLCIDCGRIQALRGHVRCFGCHSKMLNYKRRPVAS